MSGTEDLRVAVLGVGVMGADHVDRINRRISGARVTVISDVSAERAAEVGASAPDAQLVVDPFEAIAVEDVDAVLLATPSAVHAEQALACVNAGKPVLCEKPLATDSESALEIVRREAELGRRLVQVGFMRRFDHEHQRLKSLIDAGELGQPLVMHCVHRNPAVPPQCDSAAVIWNSVVHEIDATRYLLSEEVMAITVLRPTPSSHAEEGLQDPQLVILETETGRMVDIEAFVTSGVGYEVRTEVVGERGSAMIGLDVGLVRRTDPGRWGGQITPGFRERFGQAYDNEVQRWVDAVRAGGGTGDCVDGPGAWDGYAAAAVCTAGIRSLETWDRIEVDMVPRSTVGGSGSAGVAPEQPE
ncbi:oxidoreductase, NAD-binding Rossmann fold family protein [Rhodococcus sp. MTM3W5.2]|uniref:Gfo/Idh/MocA family protein n=1 Tax=Rhodococcus sp. MTM3W5.2 TaxID=1805827 RepID=UPI0009793203|nr:Gfo/Idh/MocA family oxidoreductase [Rhodococcus sp. MTM3W5.2]AQA22286.1 oxidoreductase, NAD-binding Rossmann fold family protein [Rhodococcus sp. MTM3W5.2]